MPLGIGGDVVGRTARRVDEQLVRQLAEQQFVQQLREFEAQQARQAEEMAFRREQEARLARAAEAAEAERKIPKRTAVTTVGPQGEPLRRVFTDEELIQGVPEYREPKEPKEPPRRTAVTTIGPKGEPIRRAFTEEELTQGVPEYREPPAPREPRQPQYQWATDPADGRIKLMTPEEIRGGGGQQPPTADMRNKEVARGFVSQSINAIQNLSKRVITKRGIAQRAVAAGRSVEAALGNDPDYRVYQDARTALAGNLAVAQQGSRPSDADIRAVWLPLVPDVFNDTDQSAAMKWDLINTMSLPAGRSGPQTPPPERPVAGESAYDRYLRRSRGGG